MVYTLKDDVVLSTYTMGLLFYLIIYLFIIFIVLILYSIIKNRSFMLLNIRFYAKILFVLLLLIILLFGLILRVIIFEITMDSEDASLVFVLLNALLFNIYINACFSGLVKNNNQFIKFGMAGTIIYVTASSLGMVGFRIFFDIETVIPFIFIQKTFEYNTPVGTRFMFYNQGLFFIIFVSSLLLESKRRN